jgi:hypothetical protein
LRSAGHQVFYVPEFDAGVDDEAVLAHANRYSSLLITADKDFGELVVRRKVFSRGVLLYRLEGKTLREKIGLVCAVIAERGEELTKMFTVVSFTKTRSRLLQPDEGNGHPSN